jgi:hypothetical protein
MTTKFDMEEQSSANDLGTCPHPEDANTSISFDCDDYVHVCSNCDATNYDNCPVHPESYRDTSSYNPADD